MKLLTITTALLLALSGLSMADRIGDIDAARKAAEEALKKAKEALKGGRPELPDEIRAQQEAYIEERKALREALKAEIKALGAEAPKGEVKDVIANFQAEHVDLINAQREAAEALRDAAKEARDAQRENAPEGVKALRDILSQSREEKKAGRDALREALAAADTDEERKALFDEHKAEQRDLHRQFRDELKKLREEIRNNLNDGDRRDEE